MCLGGTACLLDVYVESFVREYEKELLLLLLASRVVYLEDYWIPTEFALLVSIESVCRLLGIGITIDPAVAVGDR